jgi:hypothetical protein
MSIKKDLDNSWKLSCARNFEIVACLTEYIIVFSYAINVAGLLNFTNIAMVLKTSPGPKMFRIISLPTEEVLTTFNQPYLTIYISSLGSPSQIIISSE